MTATFKSLKWNKGSRYVEQGVRGGRTPYNAVRGGNGSFVCEDPSELILTLVTEDGREISRDIIHLVRGVNSWCRISKNRFERLEAKLKGIHEFELGGNNYIVGLEDYVFIN